MKKITLAFITIFALLFIGCSDDNSSKTSKEKEVIKVGTSGGYFPFTFYKDDKLQGFEIDVWNAIGEKLDAKIEFKTAKFSGLFGMLETGKIDTISNQITTTPKRLEKYYFPTPYVYDGAQIIVHKDNNEIKSFEDLKGKKVGVTLGTNYAQIVRSLDTNNEVELITYEGNGFEQDVKLKRIAAFVQDRISAVELIKKANLPLKIVGEPLEVLTNSFPFVKNEKNKALVEKVNKAIKELKQDGTLKKISVKWFDSNITEK
ncbi:amino acid ABC transporter substrate-binding protein [Malaciobacter marinus]|jgi:ABC-type amino acid transport substrate-binding protein|uniref:Amino acid ABC transporter substrate-binding protein n=1 Tax=Malaciobacter marinus TaxID=505249 RepID=A0A1T5BPY3_9BACT|nr:amino acid ABC transporter substrate-binding protein [Malaciobacter marinus]AXX86193.1 amino acid ABC transporter, periplasmic amino acid-binding protein [Malaciobacter marinus]PHO16755.1 amino acid ABC transporter substrate-binding protein [Malaciobacter marinus]PPK61013.1 putative amino-acid transport system substrate-binding protein [Malaciobacter marinus]SKB49000.1 putative amino-acid transport system substrate-binding protein [Malaciobacter marinus]